MKSLGERILYLRKKSNLTQKELSESIKVARSSIGKIENNEVSPSAEILVELSKTFKVSIDWLLTENEYEKNDTVIKYTKDEVTKIIENAYEEDKNIIFGFLSKFEKENQK
ncbi:helix-turn-helix domain-containing protein [Clostridium estertheticum]|uniref:helix-turn-helix domain-containing protein n=1 Tax=Clostridium estertheticum TaxID=238834 RepID=UPI001C0E60C7|nr:helix-turn-helix transcriptional regulator [Clostridium estertheticum]MBU3179112.1 helix-turn-helix domain-containing protein [Clostridium estertheticum]